jgi:Fe-S-cluster formation regulator IscX/YfhJ
MSCPLVQPETIRLTLPSGDYIDVKKELTAGEQRRVFTDMLKTDSYRTGESPQLDPDKVGFTRLLQYIVGWSYTDFSGQPLPITDTVLRQLRQADLRDLMTAVDDHAIQQELELDGIRKNQQSATGLKVISGSRE